MRRVAAPGLAARRLPAAAAPAELRPWTCSVENHSERLARKNSVLAARPAAAMAVLRSRVARWKKRARRSRSAR